MIKTKTTRRVIVGLWVFVGVLVLYFAVRAYTGSSADGALPPPAPVYDHAMNERVETDLCTLLDTAALQGLNGKSIVYQTMLKSLSRAEVDEVYSHAVNDRCPWNA